MRITNNPGEIVHSIDYQHAEPGGGISERRLDVLACATEGLPDALEGLVCTSDLQGREVPSAPGREPRLLGVLAAEELQLLSEMGALPDARQLGVLLAGDFYAAPDLSARGVSGDVTEVWRAFDRRFRWIAGVAGNHDQFPAGAGRPPGHPGDAGGFDLDDRVVALAGVRVAGVGGIIGRIGKPNRRPESEFRRVLQNVLSARPDVLVLHNGPDVPESGAPGSSLVRHCLLESPPCLVVCGHCYWRDPIRTLPNGTQICNVDSRVVVLRRQQGGRLPGRG